MRFSITEDLWFGYAPASDPSEQAAVASMTTQATRILDLRPLPVAAQRLMTITRNPDYRVSEIEKVILAEPTLSARVMRIVNSAAFGLHTRCTSVQHAIVILGGRALCDLAFALVVFGLGGTGGDGPQGRVTAHSSAVAVLCRQLALHLGRGTDEAFTVGLFHDLGKLLQLQLSVEDYTGLLVEARDQVHLRERETLGYDHAVLGGHILRAWAIPEPIPTVVAWHHQPGRALGVGGAIAEQVALVRLADRLAHLLPGIDPTDEAAFASLGRGSSAEHLGFGPTELIELWPVLQRATLASRQLFS